MSSYSRSEDLAATPAKTGWPDHFSVRLFPIGSAERRLALGVVDLLLLSSALIISVATRTELLPDSASLFGYGKWFVTLFVVWALVATIFDAYNLARAASATYGFAAGAAASSVTSLIYLAIPWLTPPLENRTQAALFLLLATVSVAGWRFVYARLFVHPAFQRRALIVGAGRYGVDLAEALQTVGASTTANPFRGSGYVLRGFVDDRPELWGQTLAGVPVLGGSGDLIRLARSVRADEVIVAPEQLHDDGAALYEALLDCRELGIPVTNLTSVYERLTGRVAVEHAGHDLESVSGHHDSALHHSNAAAQRLLDLAVVVGALVPVLLLTGLVALVNAATSPGPLFFRQQRIGQGGRPFQIIKFRTMVPGAEKMSGAVWAGRDDDRVTPFGRVLRRTHLDELPQVFNILRGEMSVVGPRPERPEFVGNLAARIPFYRARHSVRPGITGWAQIHQNYGDSVALAKEKLEFDLFYVKHASFVLDVLILLRTLAMTFGMRGR